MNVLVFKTNIDCHQDVKTVSEVMCDCRIHRWNVDMHDIDNVLRIESKDVEPSEIIDLVTRAGFFCEELPD